MYVESVPNKANRPAILLRESYRDGKKVKKRTVANLSHCPKEVIENIRLTIKGKKLAPVDEIFSIERSIHHGHVQAVTFAMRQLGFSSLLRCIPSPHREVVTAMTAARILRPTSKLSTSRWWGTTTLPAECCVQDFSVDKLYKALDYLASKQDTIEKNLAKRHLEEGQVVLYDLSSSYVEGTECPLAKRGYNRDKKRGKLQVNYGLLTNKEGCPVSLSVFEGNVHDSRTVMEQVQRLRDNFGISKVLLVGDRGMITQSHIDGFRKEQDEEGVAPIQVITALKSQSIKKLMGQGAIQLSLFDQQNIATITHPDYPGERLVVCRNPFLAEHRARKREELLVATEKLLAKIAQRVEKGSLVGEKEIALEVGSVVNKYKVAKHFQVNITDSTFSYERNKEKIEEEGQLDGLYVIRTTVAEEEMDAREVVGTYKQLSMVEQAFRNMKTDALHVRPFFHYAEQRVKAHLFLCMLAYYVRWHMEQALAPYLFVDEEKDAARDPVLPARPSESAKDKAKKKKLSDGTVVQSFEDVLNELSTIVQNHCHYKDASACITITTTPTAYQKKLFQALKSIPKL